MNAAHLTYHPIQTQSHIDYFLEHTNGLHDAYLIGVEYVHAGHSGDNPYFIDPDKAELRLRWLVSSMWDAVVELVFTAPLKWQLQDQGLDILDTAVAFTEKGFVFWADDASTDPERPEDGSWVIARAMKWRFL